MNKQQIKTMVQLVASRKNTVAKGGVYDCPVCFQAYTAADSKQMFCTNKGAGNCKDHYHAVRRSRLGVHAQAEIMITPHELNEAEVGLIARVNKFRGHDRKVYVHHSNGMVESVMVFSKCEFGGGYFEATVNRAVDAEHIPTYIKHLEDILNA